MDGRMDGQTDRGTEITPFILEDIVPFGPLPKKWYTVCTYLFLSAFRQSGGRRDPWKYVHTDGQKGLTDRTVELPTGLPGAGAWE